MSALTPRMSGAIVCLLVLIVGVPGVQNSLAVFDDSVSVSCDFEQQHSAASRSSSKTDSQFCNWVDLAWKPGSAWQIRYLTEFNTQAVCLHGGSARLQSPWWIDSASSNFRRQSAQCLSFAYHVTPNNQLGDSSKSSIETDLPQLALLKNTHGSCSQLKAVRHGDKKLRTSNCDNWELWTSAAANNAPGGNWFTQAVTIEPDTDFKLIFEGTIPANNPNARICVDNITAYHRPCHQIAASAYEASMRRWLEPMVFIFIGALAFALIIAVSIFAIRVNRRRSKKLSPGSSEDGSASPQRPNRQQHHRRQQEAMLLHAERLADGPASGSAAVGAVPIGHGHGPRRPAPPVPAEQPSLDELLSNGHRAAASATAPAAAAGHNDPPPRYEEAMGLVASAAAGSSSASDQLPPPHPPRLNRRNGGHVV
ncbi:hypothetical protein BOX15_Mlig029915g2 [Macrostomum lignano]|uniref:MAM domain-containing protein n=1 Tax=Macrostomum lignano TaxID=282301 RepID=A0A267H677_9PLAT|nr:hypothetical protein BOX15_Mlig029915g2 [Macrostomum lignano]